MSAKNIEVAIKHYIWKEYQRENMDKEELVKVFPHEFVTAKEKE